MIELENKKNNKNILPILIILIGIFLLFVVLIPQLLSVFDLKQKIRDKQDSLKKVTDILETVENTDEKVIDNNLILAESAYLNLGNAVDIYLGAYSAALEVNAVLRSMSLQVGPVYYRNIDLQNESDFNTISLNITVESDNVRNLINYGKELYVSIPLSEVQNVSIEDEKADYEVKIYQRPYDYKSFSQPSNIKTITQNQLKTLDTIKHWKERNDILLEKLQREEQLGILEQVASVSGEITLSE